MGEVQTQLFAHEFATTAPANPVYCHQEFLEKLEGHRNHPIGKRAALLLQRLAVDERRQHYKPTHGVNQGWRRSRLGGNHGSQFYAWWAPRTAAPLKAGEGFQEAPEGAIFLRDIRHHDDHSPARAQSFLGHYLPVTVPELRGEDFSPAPWTPAQARFAGARAPVRVLKGHPGSGKTTALLHAADSCGAARVLYLTYSSDLAALARQYFDRFCSRARRFHVVTFESFLRQFLRLEAPVTPLAELRRRFRGDLVPFSRSLGAWTDRPIALYDELHAHLVGAALPVAVGRFTACPAPRAAPANYRDRRHRHLGPAADAALDLAARLERADSRSLAERYFPELSLAWQAASSLTGQGSKAPAEFVEFDCIAVDECQDLTPLEAFVITELAAQAGRRRAPVQVFLAGDEAQTVRPTDFEWGWMNDLLHHRVGTPAEFKLASNLRSPRGIAQLVNRVWDLYAEVDKRDRPSGSGYAEIDDDATDQILYCTAAPGEELDRLLLDLASREGLAMVTFDEAVRDSLPERVRPAVLTASEVKGLDFHTVCLINAGKQLEAITHWRDDRWFAGADIESIRRRLAIDELRVALSRPAERILWLDIQPHSKTVRLTLDFLNRDNVLSPVSPAIPAAILTALAEEQLDLEERIQRCQSDARQFLAVKPEIAWSRAQQAVTLLGDPQNSAAVRDEAVARGARLTLAEICFSLALRDVALPTELGRPDLFGEASRAAGLAGRHGLGAVIHEIGAVIRSEAGARIPALGRLVQSMAHHQEQVEPWVLIEIGPRTARWLEELESALPAGDNALTLVHILPPFYDLLRLPDADTRKQRLFERSARTLIKNRRHAQALQVLERLPQRRPELEAECLQTLGEYARAAELYRSLGDLKQALACYRAVPDFDAAITLLREIGDHPAGPSYQWLDELRQLLARRPQNLNRVLLPSEKKILEQLLEQGLGVARKKPAPRKKAPAVKKPRQPKSYF
jgi:hypothetical protein